MSSACAMCRPARRWDTAALTSRRRRRALPWFPLATATAWRGKFPSLRLALRKPRLVAAKCCCAAIVGRISMDLTLVDVTRVAGAAIGDEVVLIGRSGEQEITAWDHARWADTVVYETLCNLSKRVPRRHAW